MHGVYKENKKIISRVRRIVGQLHGVEKMILNDTYCIDIITQTSAIKSAISSLENEMLESHLSHCLHKNIKGGQLKKIQQEIIKVYTLKRK